MFWGRTGYDAINQWWSPGIFDMILVHIILTSLFLLHAADFYSQRVFDFEFSDQKQELNIEINFLKISLNASPQNSNIKKKEKWI